MTQHPNQVIQQRIEAWRRWLAMNAEERKWNPPAPRECWCCAYHRPTDALAADGVCHASLVLDDGFKITVLPPGRRVPACGSCRSWRFNPTRIDEPSEPKFSKSYPNKEPNDQVFSSQKKETPKLR